MHLIIKNNFHLDTFLRKIYNFTDNIYLYNYIFKKIEIDKVYNYI